MLSKDKTKPIILYTTNVNSITGKAQVAESCYNSSRTYWWDLKQVYTNGSEILNSYYTFDENQPKSIVIAFAKESISVGLYSLHLTVNLTEIQGGFIKDYLYVQFSYPEFVTGIAGGTERTISYNTQLTLDAVSKTEDLVTAISDPFIFDWKCKKTDASESEISAIIANFHSGMVNSYHSIPTDCNVPLSGGVVTVPPIDLEAGFWFIYQVNATKGDRSNSGIQAVFVLNGLVPNVLIRCIRNCLQKISADTRVILETSCTECQGRTTTYTWIIQKFNTTLNQYEAITDPSSIIESDLHSDGLGIRAHSLEENFSYRLKLTVDTGSPYQPIEVTYQFKVNQPPYGGTCSISPTEGDASITIFSIRCDGWLDEGYRNIRNPMEDNNEYLMYKIIQQRNESLNSIISESPESLIISRLNVGDPNNDYLTTIIVRVTDSYNGYADFTLTAKVRDPISYNTSSTQETISKIEAFISSVIDEAELTNDAGIFIQSAETIISVLNLQVVENVTTYTVNQKPSEWNTGLLDVTDNQNLSSYQHLMDNLLRKEEDKIQMVVKEGVRNLTSRMLSKLQEGNASTYSMLELSSSAFANVISNSKFVSADSAIDAVTALQMIASGFANTTENTLKHPIQSSTSEIESTANSIFGLISNLVEVTVPENLNSSYYALSTTNIAVSRQLVDFEAFLIGDPAYALAEDAKITPEERTGVYRLRARIQQYEMQQKHDLAKDTTPAVIEAIGLMTSSLLDTVCKSCKDIFLTANVDTLLMKTEIKQIQAKNTLQSTEIKISFKQGSDLETTGRLSLVSFHKSPFIYGSKLEDGASVTSLVHKITLTSEEKREIATTEKISLKQPTNVVLKDYFEPTFTPGDASKMFYHVFYYRQLEDSVCFNIKPSVPVRISSYDVFIKQDTYPTHLQYDARAYVAPEKDWMTCIGPSYLSFTGKTYVGLKPTPISGINATEASLSPYNFTIVTSACKSWDNSKGLWDGSPCIMDWFPTESYIECDCSPSKEMTFANTFYVAPNTIDFSTVFLKFSPLNQAAVLATLCLILVIYILLMIWARHQDKKDQVKWGVTPLADNFVDDTYYYLLTVYTGMRSGAGTRSRIGFILSGSDGDTGIRELYDGVRREMSTGSVMYYIMAVSEPLGELDYIYIWHDNSGGGSNASWYLARIDIEDIQKKERCLDNDVREQGSKYKVPVFGDWMDTFMKDSKELEKTLVARGILDTDETILPFWCVYIAWILVAIASIIPGFFILLFSMQWGKQKSELWLSRFFLSFFESSFLLDPLKVVLMAVIFAIIFKQKEKFKPTGLDREIVLKNYRQRFGHKTGFRFPSPPLTAATIQKAREERQRDMKMMGSLKEVVVTLIFLWIIFSISYSNRDDRSYLLHRNVVKEILDPIELTKPKFTKITNTEQLIQWFNWTAFPALFPEKEYNSKQLHWRWRQYFSDLYNYRVGPPRLRQLRVRKEERNIPEFGNVVYYPNYNLLTETDENLCYSWKKPPCDLEMEAYSFSYGAWKHTSATDIWGVPVMGLYTTYGGDQEFSSIPDERMTYVSLLNDLRDTIYTAFYDETKPTKPLLPPESTHKKKVRTNSTSSEKSSL
ncbi:hypothetical protein KUTeg_003081 [Tegillarca granosa]|uniref:Uncharacterized protein n=1 Tax=Tegillarca granosa TaxID=220873 RepID=A0ABQ9FL28_TEGGR|nr:hypothetical protein KUTeg_003081 [Tegillarca granosa]